MICSSKLVLLVNSLLSLEKFDRVRESSRELSHVKWASQSFFFRHASNLTGQCGKKIFLRALALMGRIKLHYEGWSGLCLLACSEMLCSLRDIRVSSDGYSWHPHVIFAQVISKQDIPVKSVKKNHYNGQINQQITNDVRMGNLFRSCFA